MISRVRFTPPADQQFLSLITYIRAENPAAAKNLRNHVSSSFENICTFPEMGRIVPEFPDLGFREVIINPYRFFYTVENDTVWVVGVWHAAQLPEKPIL